MPPSLRPAFRPRYMFAHLPAAIHLLAASPLKTQKGGLDSPGMCRRCLQVYLAEYDLLFRNQRGRQLQHQLGPPPPRCQRPVDPAWRFSGTGGVCCGFLPSVGRASVYPPNVMVRRSRPQGLDKPFIKSPPGEE